MHRYLQRDRRSEPHLNRQKFMIVGLSIPTGHEGQLEVQAKLNFVEGGLMNVGSVR